jgi:phytoene desaturase
MARHIVIIGGGIGGLASAILLARAGNRVSVFEKNSTLGGSCNTLSEQGFTFDTGPSWYMMPEVFEEFFENIGEDVAKYLRLVPLHPSQRAFFDDHPRPFEFMSDLEKDLPVFESIEPGSTVALKKYYLKSKRRYEIAIPHIRDPYSETLYAYMKLFFAGNVFGLGRFNAMGGEIDRAVRSSELRALLRLPSLFLGTAPEKTPAMFNFLTYADFGLGIQYPIGGMYSIVRSLVAIGKTHGVEYRVSSSVRSIEVSSGKATGIALESGETISADVVLSNANRPYTEGLLPRSSRDHSDAFWQKTKPTFSALILFLGIGKKLPELAHHNLFFSKQWEQHLRNIEQGILSDEPSFYVGAPSVTDPSCAPPGMENLFVLIPVPAEPTFSKEALDACADAVIEKIAARMPSFKQAIIVDRRWYPNDFGTKYNSFRNSAMGLAHTMWQTAPFRPSQKSSGVENLYFVGATTDPGIGVPSCLISAERVARMIAEGN